MIFIKKLFNSNSQTNKTLNSFQSVDGFLEKDAAPVKNTNADELYLSNLSTELTSEIPNEGTNSNISDTFNRRSRQESLVNNDTFSSEINTMNVHNANQQVVMQFSNVNKLHIGSVYNINNRSTTDNETEIKKERTKTKLSKDKSNYPKKTTSIEAMMQSKEEPKKDLLIAMSTHLGIGWKQVMRELGYSEGQISSTYLDHHVYGTNEVIYQLLLDWVRNAEDELRSVGYLTKLLWNCGHRECVHRLKLVWKSDINSKMNSQK